MAICAHINSRTSGEAFERANLGETTQLTGDTLINKSMTSFGQTVILVMQEP